MADTALDYERDAAEADLGATQAGFEAWQKLNGGGTWDDYMELLYASHEAMLDRISGR